MEEPATGVVVPVDARGRRSSSALGRAVVADALRTIDPVGAADAERETNWRSGYPRHFRRLTEAGLASPQAARTIAAAGLAALHRRMHYRAPDGEISLDRLAERGGGSVIETERVHGRGEQARELAIPVDGRPLSGDALRRRLDDWLRAGVLEPAAADRVHTVLAHPEWLSLPGRTVVALGAGAEMGPVPALLRWGATVAGVDLPGGGRWERLRRVAAAGGGTLLGPARGGITGLDLLTDVEPARRWLAGLDGALVLGNYVYADGALNLRLSAAVDALTDMTARDRPDLALAFLATPTDVFAVPAEAAAEALRRYRERPAAVKLLGRPVRAFSGGRLLQRPYADGIQPALHDSLVVRQGPNYALAKRLQRWRAVAARAAGRAVSLNVAPPTRTRSVVKNRALAAAYAGAHRFGVTVFEPATANSLMAALLVADLQDGGGPAHEHPWQDEAFAAVHGGLWRCGYQPRSALGLAALLGVAAART